MRIVGSIDMLVLITGIFFLVFCLFCQFSGCLYGIPGPGY